MTLEDIKDHELRVRKKRIVICFDKVSARLVLYFLLLTGTTLSCIMQSIMPMSLSSMVKQQQTASRRYKTCFMNNTNSTIIKTPYIEALEWRIDVQHYTFTKFYWIYVIAQVIGGIVVQRFGGKTVTGYGLLISSMCIICIHLANDIHYVLVIIFQISHGLSQGIIWPGLYGLMSTWVPACERSFFVTCLQGTVIGVIIGQMMTGFTTSKSRLIYVFATAGTAGIGWCLIWYFLVYNTPETHPYISSNELNRIQESRGAINEKRCTKIPWKRICLSLPVWAIGVSSFGNTWLNLTITLYGLSYLKTAAGFNIINNNLWIGLISIICWFSAILFSYVSEKILIHKYLSSIKSRKLFAGISQIIPGVLSISFGHLNCSHFLILTIWCLLNLLPTASFSGSMVNVLDLTTNFAGPTAGLTHIFSIVSCILASLVAKRFLKELITLEAWQSVFNLAGAINIICCTFFLMFASAKVQDWDKTEESNEVRKENEENERFFLKVTRVSTR